MISENSLLNIIPAPFKVIDAAYSFPLTKLKAFFIDETFSELKDAITAIRDKFRLDLIESSRQQADILLCCDHDTQYPETWNADIRNGKIILKSRDVSTMRYALTALEQMFAVAMLKGPDYAQLQCGSINDRPRFSWRSFMLDSARHFQRPEKIKEILDLLAAYRINRFHWHLTDNSGWRIKSDNLPEICQNYTLDPGYYSPEDIAGIASHAKGLGIIIVPEFDIPGHCGCLLKTHPQYGCANRTAGNEICVGNMKTRRFIKDIIRGIIDLFPESPYIHIGGDEAADRNWKKCPVCSAATEKKSLSSMRALEHDFMLEMTSFVTESGRTPIIWGNESDFQWPDNVIIQCWLNINDPIRFAAAGNKCIYSVHHSLYFDYPASMSEPHFSWMFQLSESGVYMTDPYMTWPDKVRESIIGTEACLWTEIVPQWRIMEKIRPRIAAYAECAWTMPENKNWHDFIRRKGIMELGTTK